MFIIHILPLSEFFLVRTNLIRAWKLTQFYFRENSRYLLSLAAKHKNWRTQLLSWRMVVDWSIFAFQLNKPGNSKSYLSIESLLGWNGFSSSENWIKNYFLSNSYSYLWWNILIVFFYLLWSCVNIELNMKRHVWLLLFFFLRNQLNITLWNFTHDKQYYVLSFL